MLPAFLFPASLLIKVTMLIVLLVACAMCGKNLIATGKESKDQPVVQGQKFNCK